jgi:hypothetical protein
MHISCCNGREIIAMLIIMGSESIVSRESKHAKMQSSHVKWDPPLLTLQAVM